MEIENYNEVVFESIKHIDDDGCEYWEARELQRALDYDKWDNFNKVIQKGIIACEKSGNAVLDHFPDVGKMVETGDSKRIISNYHLSRYACYLIAQNADSRKKVVALAQTYFATQTRKQEVLEEKYKNLSEDEKRILERKKVRKENYTLNKTAINAGVKKLGEFHNAGYKGLYNGETANDIFKRKKLRYREDILDNMGSEELADNWFRIVQTESKLKRDKINNEYDANSIHYKVGKEVRNSIKRLGGTMPEDLPTPIKSITELDNSLNKLEN